MHAALLSVALMAPAADPADAGVLPAGADGRPLNLDFETGTLKDWTADGDAFRDQPVKGDTVAPRRGDSRSGHQGRFWVGGYEKHGDPPTGTLTSVPFKVTHPWASLLVGGGPHATETCVELVLLPQNEVFFRASGTEKEDLERVAVDLTKHQGKDIQIRLVDKHTGHWGHVNFDDFRFHTTEPFQRQRSVGVKADAYPHAGLPPDQAAKAMTVPPGFAVKLFAGEPDVHQPVAMCTDDRGRLWVVEAYTYPRRHPHPGPVIPADAGKTPPPNPLPAAERGDQTARLGASSPSPSGGGGRGEGFDGSSRRLGDRIVIFEDTDGDGKHDKRTTFIEGLNLVSGIELGFGGVWVGAAPYLLFIPDKDGDDKPDGEPQVLLDGWGYEDTHETLNSFIWGPDGWLYGCHGVFTHSKVGKPGTPDDKRVPINAGIWRYHPTRHTFEVFAHGTSNPWGLDYNAQGEFFIEACVIPHMWHIVQGGRYHRQGGTHFNPYTFDDIQTIAVHRHFVGNQWNDGDRSKSNDVGGGHAHSGLLCYQGGLWPKEYHGKLFMGNLHGHRINVDALTPKGSGYVADRNPDFLLTNDKWSVFVGIQASHDGNAYVIDWYDKQICHRNEPEIWDRTNGRVYKVVYKDTKPAKVDLKKCSDEELVKYQTSDNEWYVRHARRLLQERAAARGIGRMTIRVPLTQMLKAGMADERQALRALWVLHSTGGLAGAMTVPPRGASDTVVAWVVRLLAQEGFQIDGPGADDFTRLAHGSPSPVVRRALASALQGMLPAERWGILAGLVSHPDDAADHNLPYLYWYALEPLVAADPARGLKLAADAKVPQLLPWAARRVGAVGTPEAVALLVKATDEAATAEQQLAYLHGIADGLKGKRQFPMPAEWATTAKKLGKAANADIRSQVQALGVVFGDPAAVAAVRAVAGDVVAATGTRAAAVRALIDARDPQLVPVLHGMLADPALRSLAVRGLAAFDDPKTPAVLLAAYGTFNTADKRDAVATLASRPGYAKALMAAVAAKQVPAADISAETVRQLRNLGDAALDKSVADLWGSVRETPADRKRLIGEWRAKLTRPYAGPVDLGLGRAVFARTCQQCHVLYAVGGKVGPEITGSNRANLDYLLENILDPSAVIPKEYAATRLGLADGRVLTGIVKDGPGAALTVVTATETVVVPAADVEDRKASELSMMPDDILKQVNEVELRALVAYLQHPQQVPMLATPENAKDFFNGKDLTGWDGDKDVWSVQNGEIVGKSEKGLKANTFLTSAVAVEDFKLSLKTKLTPNDANSGIQFRSVRIEGGEMRGPQADMGKGWWGKLYEESGRGLLAKEDGDKHVKPGDWNDYVIEARGPKVTITINGQVVTDYTDEKLARRGLIGLQVHSGGPTEVRFKDIKLEVLK